MMKMKPLRPPLRAPQPASGFAPRAAAGWLAALSVAVLAGCSFIPPYQRPEAPVSRQWPQESQPVPEAQQENAPSVADVPAGDLPWQQFFADPSSPDNAELEQIIELALVNNRDLRVAIANIEQARAQYQIQRAGVFPTIGLDVNQTRTGPNPYESVGLGGSVSSSAGWSVGITSWELDLFGRIRALKDVALAQFLATEEARKSTQMSLIANVAGA
jgi:multidrug efflux system outer membrane protein